MLDAIAANIGTLVGIVLGVSGAVGSIFAIRLSRAQSTKIEVDTKLARDAAIREAETIKREADASAAAVKLERIAAAAVTELEMDKARAAFTLEMQAALAAVRIELTKCETDRRVDLNTYLAEQRASDKRISDLRDDIRELRSRHDALLIRHPGEISPSDLERSVE